MPKRKKFWSSIRLVTFASSVGLMGCNAAAVEQEAAFVSDQINQVAVVTSNDEEEVTAVIDMTTNDLAYLTQLGLIRGHLYVGHKLYMAGHIGHAKTHMKHPESELYADIVPAFAVRNTPGFEQSLEGLANAVNGDLGSKKVDLAYRKLLEDIAISETAVNQSSQTSAEKLKLAAKLLRVAGEEYAIAVVNGKMENAHEYQDAMGFKAIAQLIISHLDANAETQQYVTGLFDSIMPLWPSLIPPLTLDTDAGEIYRVAAKIELLVLSL